MIIPHLRNSDKDQISEEGQGAQWLKHCNYNKVQVCQCIIMMILHLRN